MAKKNGHKKNILVLGGAGFIGSHICDALVKDNNVICVDNFISGSQRNIDHLLREPNFVFLKEDLNTLTDLEKFTELERFDIKFYGIQEIYNLACPTSPKDFESRTLETVLANSCALANALNIAVKYKSKFLHFSTSTVYGSRSEADPVMKEDKFYPMDPLSPRGSYDEGKRFAETLVWTYKNKFGLDAKILRTFTTFGPRMPLFQGHMIPDFIVAALDNQPLVIYGDENFTQTLCFVTDVISAALKMMASAESGPFNIGNPQEVKLSEIAKKIIAKTGSASKVKHEKPLLFLSRLGVPDITLAKNKLEWFPVITLENGLDLTIEYAQANKVVVDWQKQTF